MINGSSTYPEIDEPEEKGPGIKVNEKLFG